MVGAAEAVDGGFDGFGALLDFGADGEADVWLMSQNSRLAATPFHN